MFWQLILVLTFVPLPIRPKLVRPDPTKNFWTFECDGFISCYQQAKVFYNSTRAAEMLEKTQ